MIYLSAARRLKTLKECGIKRRHWFHVLTPTMLRSHVEKSHHSGRYDPTGQGTQGSLALWVEQTLQKCNKSHTQQAKHRRRLMSVWKRTKRKMETQTTVLHVASEKKHWLLGHGRKCSSMLIISRAHHRRGPDTAQTFHGPRVLLKGRERIWT